MEVVQVVLQLRGQLSLDWQIVRIQALSDAQAAFDAAAYSRNRAAEYPSIGDQLDMQYHDAIDSTTTWRDAIAAVKTKYAKPS